MRTKKVTENIDPRIRPEAETLVKQLQALSKKLRETAQMMPGESLIIEYDNGGGQAGVRENPYYPAYEKLLASYTKTLLAVKDLIGDQPTAEIKNLDSIRKQFKVAK